MLDKDPKKDLMGLPGFELGSCGPEPKRIPSYPIAPFFRRQKTFI